MTADPEFPAPSFEPPPPLHDFEAARAAVRAPAIAIIVMNVLSVLAAPPALLLLGPMREAIAKQAEHDPEMRGAAEFYSSQAIEVLLGFGLVLGVLGLIGGVRMLQSRSHGFAVAAAVLTMVNTASCCCLANLGVGIWALVVLMRDEVQQSFDRR